MRFMARVLGTLLSLPMAALAQARPQASTPVTTEQHPARLHGDEPYHAWRERPLAVDATLGIATPLGLAGVSAEYAPFEYASFGAGVGTNLIGWQLAAMGRARYTPEEGQTLYVGAGYSQGRHSQSEGNRDGLFSLVLGPLSAMGHNPKRGHDWRTARWLNLEAGQERRTAGGLDVRGFIGCAILLNRDAGIPAPPDNNQSALLPVRELMLFAGAAIGFAL